MLLSSYRATAIPAADKAGEGKNMPLGPGLPVCSQKLLDAIILLHANHWLVLALVSFASPIK
ncbi:hypothetical protein A3D09_02210 [Candidatus Collierbacteria bacterium RIFCSPHIGHO2_02_FULL_49_10]|uniref:Uncharacterized protein n=1 Tax=Candidatus Collierbacteria bacterium RIFCSPHIGHO2_02_FULL_49_10 TaxID=1817723 RepID=A0A1F5EVZ2_9BACT|nr:MAG: hypothetical protein A3D09_02210 [Candidatus Collierbacteria bacterium RIFCSPHIGHO2_02_FULL_49_10]